MSEDVYIDNPAHKSHYWEEARQRKRRRERRARAEGCPVEGCGLECDHYHRDTLDGDEVVNLGAR
jgi:hypothetical protein